MKWRVQFELENEPDDEFLAMLEEEAALSFHQDEIVILVIPLEEDEVE